MTLGKNTALELGGLTRLYRDGGLTPGALVAGLIERVDARGDDKVWIHRISDADLMARAKALEETNPEGLPLYGIPFAIKDNMDVAGLTTTAGCPAYAYVAEETAPAVARLLDAGAILVGKTNLDQFATGLVGVRTPYGIPGNSFDPSYVPGGSSSGSAVAVAAGLASFSLGTDTAGSGRVPAAFNNIVGLKPTRGLLSCRGVVPACRSLDCVSIFALTSTDAAAVLGVAGAYDPGDAFSRDAPAGYDPTPTNTPAAFRFGVPRPEQLEFFGNGDAAALFDAAVERLEGLGGRKTVIDFAPFQNTARLLYDGPWVDERRAAVGDFIAANAAETHPVTRKIILEGKSYSAVDAYRAYYRLRELKQQSEPVWDDIDILFTPTAGTIYSIAEVEADPIRLNANLGYYTNYINLLDLAGVSVPAGLLPNGLPFGVTLAAPAYCEQRLLAIGDAAHRATGLPMGATGLPLERSH
ncbi:MAG: allophanate hydrolase [Pseudomonadota bacterium]